MGPAASDRVLPDGGEGGGTHFTHTRLKTAAHKPLELQTTKESDRERRRKRGKVTKGESPRPKNNYQKAPCVSLKKGGMKLK